MKLLKNKNISINDFGAAKVREYYNNPKSAFSLALVEYDGCFPQKGYIRNNLCNETYFIFEGLFEIEIKNDKIYKLGKYDSLCVLKKSIYRVCGKGKLISINDPPWNINQFDEL